MVLLLSAARTAAASHACASKKCKRHPDSAALRDRSTNAQWGAEAATLLDVLFVTSLSVTTTGTMVAAVPAVNTHVADTYTPPTCISKVCLVVVHQLLQHTHVLQDVDCRSAHSITAVLVCSNRCRRKGAVSSAPQDARMHNQLHRCDRRVGLQLQSWPLHFHTQLLV